MTAATTTTTGTLANLPLDQVRESPLNYREITDEDLDLDLQAAMASQGQLTPLLVRPVYRADSTVDHYEIAAGARRRRCAERLGWSTIAAVVREMDDRTFLEALATENLQRHDPHPLDEAVAYEQLGGLGYSNPQIAERVGKPVTYVARRLKLVDLVPSARKAFLAGKIYIGHAEALARYTAEQQEKGLKVAIGYGGEPWPVKRLQDQLERDFHHQLGRAPFKLEDAGLVPEAGSCIDCPKRSGTMPDLFDDVKGDNVCTDGRCYQGKVRALIATRLTEAKEAGAPLVRLSTHHAVGDRPVREGAPIPATYWSPAKKSDKGAVQGIRVNGDDPGRVVWVTLKGMPKARATDSSTKRSAPREDFYAERDRRRKAIAEREVPRRTAALQALLDRVGKDSVTPGLLRLVLRALWGDSHLNWEPYGVPDTVPTLLGVAAPGNRHDADMLLETFGPLAFQARFWIAYLGESDLNEYTVEDQPRMLQLLAELYDVDLQAILAAWDEAHPVEQPKADPMPTAKKKKATKRRAGDVRREQAAAKKKAKAEAAE